VKRTLVVALAFIFLMAAAAWATYTDPLLGPHNIGEAGCLSCHAPHNAQAGKGLYLWGLSIPTGVYNTYLTSDSNGGPVQMTSTTGSITPAAGDTSEHTILCMSCHDTAFNSGMATAIPNGAGLGAGNNYAIGAGQDLTYDHPVHIAYPKDSRYWKIVAGTDVYGNATFVFQDATSFNTGYGHAARLFPNSAGGANVECSSCHNPHAWQNAAVNMGAAGGLLTAVATDKFIRGGFSGTAGTMTVGVTDTGTATNFCLSCHAYMAAAFSSGSYLGNN